MKWLRILSIMTFFMFLSSVPSSYASQTDGTIDAISKYAWSNNAGWINFAASIGNVHITDTTITGYVWSSNYGWINLNPTQGGINNDGEGNLNGFAWGASLGWIDF